MRPTALLFGGGEDGFQVGRFLLFVYDCRLDVAEACAFQEALEIELGEAEPQVRVHFAGFLELVAIEIENCDAAVRTKDAPCLRDRLFRVDRMMESLAQKSQIDSGAADRHVFEIAETV